MWRRAFALSVAVVGLYALAGYLIVPWLAPGLIVAQLEDALRVRAAVGGFTLDPFAFRVRLTDLSLDAEDGEPLLRIARAEANLEPFDFLSTGVLALSHLRVRGADARVKVDEAGVLNWLAVLPPDDGASPAPESREEPKAEPLSLVIEEIQLRESELRVSDLSRPSPLELTITPLDLTLKSLELGGAGDTQGAPLDLTLGLASGGQIHLVGDVETAGPSTHLDIDGDALFLPNLSPLIEALARVRIRSGLLDIDGHLVYDAAGTQPFGFDGRVGIRDLAVEDADEGADVVGFRALQVEGLEIESAPSRLRIARLRLEQPTTRFVVEPGGGLNLARIASPPPRDTSAQATPIAVASGAAAEPNTSQPPQIRIDEIEVAGGEIQLSDRSVQPELALTLSDLAAGVEGIATDGSRPFALALDGKTGPHSTFSMKGSGAPFKTPRALDLKVTARNLGLEPFSPYSARYAAHAIDRGSADLDLAYSLVDVRLSGRNRILVAGLELGPRVASPDAPNVPIALGVELLKDKNGRISLDVPVAGYVDDPSFDLLALVGKTLLAQIVKVTSQPFRVLGALVPGGSVPARLSFPPGASSIGAVESGQLQSLAEVLAKREHLVLVVEGTASRDEDAPALAGARLDEELMAVHRDRWWRRSSERPAALTPDERTRALRRLHARLADAGRIHPQPPAVSGAAGEDAESARLEAEVIATIDIADADLLRLAAARGEEIRARLLSTGALDGDRIALAEPVVLDSAGRRGAGVRLGLDVR
jgi:hypothetical protein